MTDPTSAVPTTHPPRPSGPATLSLLMGVASIVVPILAGVPALLLGYRSLYAINASEGQLTGRRLALGGIILGGLTTLVAVFGFVLLIYINVSQKAWRIECANNLRAIGNAVAQYQKLDPQKAFPPGTIPNPGLPPDERLSWVPFLLPHLGLPADSPAAERKRATTAPWQGIAAQINSAAGWNDPANRTARDTVLRPFLCPGHPNFDPSAQPGSTHYVGIAGLGSGAAELSKDDPRAGFFGYDRVITDKDVTAGSSHTLLALETDWENGPWLAGGFPTVRIVPEDAEPLIGESRPFGGTHRGGMNALYIDGSVRFESDSIEPSILRNLARLHRE